MSGAREVRVRLSLDGKMVGRPSQAARIRRLLAGGELGRLHVTFVPRVVGGRSTATLLGPPEQSLLLESVPLRLERFERRGKQAVGVYAVLGRAKFSSGPGATRIQKTACKQATRRTS